jgi:hypothetical protein
VFDFIINPDFLSALATIVGPLAFFAAPTEEIEHLLYADEVYEYASDPITDIPDMIDEGYAEAA